MEYTNKYSPLDDPQFKRPYIDTNEWRGESIRYRYVHGGFEGSELKFSFFFPTKGQYQGRFFHFTAPVQGSEDASISLKGREDKITFAITHGAYFVESNMGVAVPFAPISDPTIIYRASAAAAEYSRSIAQEIYGVHRPYGYVYGGSGGGFKATSCFENTEAWDGAVPYVIGSDMAIPNCFTVRAHARRILRHKLASIADAMEPGGSGDPYATLDATETAALEEATRMGWPQRAWFLYEDMDDGALPILTPFVHAMDPEFFEDFWKLPGYLGSDPEGSAVRDRIVHKTAVVDVYLPHIDKNEPADDYRTGVDDAWKRLRGLANTSEHPLIKLKSMPASEDLYLFGTNLTVLSGDAQGLVVPLKTLDGDIVVVGEGYGMTDMLEQLAQIKHGDEVILDNSDYIAIQTYHRHQVPKGDYEGFRQFKDKNGDPIYPQRPSLLGPQSAYGSCGSIQSGQFQGKMIVVASLLDESAFPWQADWYRGKVRDALGDKEEAYFRLWFIDNALHIDSEKTEDESHAVSYLGALHQALLSLSDWVEKGITPPPSTSYRVQEGQILVPGNAKDRRGIQPVVQCLANDASAVSVAVGQQVTFVATAQLPENTGEITAAEWRFEGEDDFQEKGRCVQTSSDILTWQANASHCFSKPGIYFPVVRFHSNRNAADTFTAVLNICRVRVVVEADCCLASEWV